MFQKKVEFLGIKCFDNQKRVLYLHSQSGTESYILEKWQSGRMRQS